MTEDQKEGEAEFREMMENGREKEEKEKRVREVNKVDGNVGTATVESNSEDERLRKRIEV